MTGERPSEGKQRADWDDVNQPYLAFTQLVNCDLALCEQQTCFTLLWDSEAERVQVCSQGKLHSGGTAILSRDLTKTWTHPCRKPRGRRCSADTHRTPVSSWSSPLWRCDFLNEQAADTQSRDRLKNPNPERTLLIWSSTLLCFHSGIWTDMHCFCDTSAWTLMFYLLLNIHNKNLSHHMKCPYSVTVCESVVLLVLPLQQTQRSNLH